MVPTTLMIDRRFRGVGRIKRASGTKVPAVKRKLDRMLTALFDEGRLDILRLIRDGALTLLEVHDAYQRKALELLPTGATVAPLVKTMQAWVDGLVVPTEASDDHVRAIGSTINYLKAEREGATIADAPTLLEKLRESLGKDHPRSFNLARSHVMAFIRAKLKRSHPVWLACAAVEPRKVPKAKPRPELSPVEMRNWFPNQETDPLDAIAWSMVTTGMHAKEYWGRWETKADRIVVHGTKRESRHRSIPFVQAPVVPQWKHRRTFENAFRDRTTAFTPYDLRRSYARWMENAGIPRTRRRMYMGHSAKDVTDLYEAHELSSYLVEDAVKMRDWLGIQTASAHPLKAVK